MEFAAGLVGAPPADGLSGIDSIVETARMAEDLGFNAVFVPDHYAYERLGVVERELPAYDLFFVLAILAQATSRVRLVSHVACILFRHPAMHARLFAQIDEASGGRVVAGLGAGWTKLEFEMMGLEFPPVSQRLRMLDEAAAIMRGLWREESFSFEGEYYRLTDAVCLPKPVQAGGIPIMLGGSGNGILRRAGEWADIVHMVPAIGTRGTSDVPAIAAFTDASLPAKLARVREAEAASGRKPGTVSYAGTIFNLMLTSSERETREALEPLAGLLGLTAAEVRNHPVMLIGRPGEVAEELRRRETEHGLSLLGINAPDADSLRAFGETVLPALT